MTHLAVIIVNFNAGDMLRDCLAALDGQAVRPTRVLVMDNGSRDTSVALAKAEHPWVEFRLLQDNLGFAKANNIAIDLAADCDWVALLNPDAFAEPSWIEAFERQVRRFPDVDAFASRMLSARNPAVVDGAGDDYRVDGLAWSRHQGGPTSQLGTEPEEVFSPSAGAGFYRRRAVVAAGGFCERYFCYYEDVDLGFRLRLRGGRCVALPDAIVRHVGSAITGKGSEFSVYHAHRNFVWTYVRNMPAAYFWMYLPAHLAANLVSIALFVMKGQSGTILRAKWHAVLGLRQCFRERREIQSARTVSPAVVIKAMRRGNALGSIARRIWRAFSRLT